MRALITGVTGFVGSHLAELLLSKGVDVYGTVRWRSRLDNIQHIKTKIKLLETDIKDAHNVLKIVNECEPDYIFHLAAQSFVPASTRAPQETMTANVIGTINVLEAARASSVKPIIQIAGSSEEYGLVHPNEVPIKESNQLRPLSPYGVSKVAEELLGYQYHKSYGMNIITTRAFNHTGPRRGDVFVTSNFAKQVVEIEKGIKEPIIHVGNLEAQRDFSDVRDVVKAYLLAVEKCSPGESYNICSGTTRSIKSMLDVLLGMSNVRNIELRTDATRLRPSDVPILLGDYSKFKGVTNWSPEIPFEKTMLDLLNYWRDVV